MINYLNLIIQLVSSVRDSIRCDLVQSHLGTISSYNTKNAKSNCDDDFPTTLVLVLAVSGGCDSIALFHSILASVEYDEQQITNTSDDDDDNTTKYVNNSQMWLHLGKVESNAKKQNEEDKVDIRIPCELHVAHFNHEQRDASSDGDEIFVKNLCIENGVPFHSYAWSEEFKIDSKNLLADDESYPDRPSFTQETARKWRRRKLKQLLSDIVLSPNLMTSSSDGSNTNRWGAILTAHHRDDADETIMLKLLRGSHLTNLWGMDARSDRFDIRESCDNVGYFAKPMLNVRKNHIVEYLTSNSFKWREDESNASSKYKRNKIRNELIPLLSEISGGDNALQKRFKNLEQQSRDISKDLVSRSKEYLDTMSSSSTFILQKYSQFDLVQEEALHLWMKEVTHNELQVSYEQMLRIREQIRNYPAKLQWTLDVGNSWKLRRNGDTLVLRDKEACRLSTDTIISSSDPVLWEILPRPGADVERESVSETQEFCFGAFPHSSTLNIKQVKDCGNIKFTPPWRKGRRAIKIKEFLRGQKVPLHLRDESIVLCLTDNDTPAQHALAVYLDDTGWIVNAKFCPRDDLPVTKVVLGKISLS